MPFKPTRVKQDVAAASAAFTVNLLDEWVKLPKPEQFERLKLHYLAALTAYQREARRTRRTRIPKPSVN